MQQRQEDKAEAGLLEIRLIGTSGEVAVALDHLRRVFTSVTVLNSIRARKKTNSIIVYVVVEL